MLRMRETLRNEQPKIDSAIKSFASLLAAGAAAAANHTNDKQSQPSFAWNLTDVLTVSRKFSRHINQHVVSIGSSSCIVSSSHKAKKKQQESSPVSIVEKEATAQVWNELVATQQKPTKLLGRTALRAVWDDLDLPHALLLPQEAEDNETNIEWNAKVQSYFEEFHQLLLLPADVKDDAGNSNDARLLWDVDRGAAELERRAAERQKRAKQQQQQLAAQQQQQQQEATTPFIVELPDDNNTEEAEEEKDIA